MEVDYHSRDMAPALSSTMDEPEGQKPSSWMLGYHTQDMTPMPSSTKDEPEGQKPLSWTLGYHTRGMILAPPLMMGPGEDSPFSEADYRTPSMILLPPLKMEPEEETKLVSEVGCHTRGMAPPQPSMTEPGEGSLTL